MERLMYCKVQREIPPDTVFEKLRNQLVFVAAAIP